MDKETSIEQLKHFLKEMFQFNANDLDFGIYRIYNLKRKEIEHFIDGKYANCLTPVIDLTLKGVANFEKKAELASLEAYLKKLNQLDLLNDPDTNYEQLKLFINTNPDEEEKKTQLEALNKATKEIDITDEIKDKIYNHILGYFEMYYSNGDFGYNNRSRNLYKVPYEADYDGSDTLFHWKHKGSLYIKTGNSFNAIKFKIKHLKKEFELRIETNEDSTDEEVARNNNKDTKLKHYKFNRFDKKDGVTQIIFNLSDSSTTKAELFKSLFKDVFKSKEDLDRYLFSKNTKGELKPNFQDLTDDYDKVNDGAVKGIGALRVKRSTLLTKVNKNFDRGDKIEIIKEKGQERFNDDTLETIYNIDQKLNSFYIGNDSDYFIHEHLEEFLTGEKERYIKNHILSDLKSILDGKLDNTTIIIAKAFDLVSTRIIEFLSAIEEFQKKLFTMKKKVVESEYCLTIDNIDEKYFPEILKNKAQLAEWEKLYSVNVKSKADLKAQPTLVLDTKFFKAKDGSNTFKDNILAEIDNLDERTNGLLIHSENYQGLEFLQERYNKEIDGIYIDPPYNTDSSSIIYKNNFKHSSWLSLLENRVKKSQNLLNDSKGMICVAIDDEEVHRIRQVLSNLFSTKVGIVAVRSNPAGRKTKGKFSPAHEYALFYGQSSNAIPGSLEITEKRLARYPKEDQDGRFAWANFIRSGNNDRRQDRPKLFYPIFVSKQDEIRIPKLKWNEEKGEYDILEKPKSNESIVFPIIDNDGTEVEKNWQRGHKRVPNELNEYRVRRTGNDKISIDFKTRMDENSLPITWWDKKEYASANYGALEQKKLFGVKLFDFPKAKALVIDSIKALSGNKESGVYLDYFSGSATTGHAILEMNKEDKGTRKFIMIEMGTYFDSVTKPRIQKVIYSQNWDAGKPVDNDGSPNHIFKYQVLEQYEDVLDAIEQFDGDTPNGLPLKYLYKPELNKIQNSLDLSKPFSNQIKYGQPTKVGFVDLVDTYNYLQGYEVKSLKTFTINKKYYKVVETLDTLVIWRDIKMKEDDSRAIIEIADKYPDVTAIEVNHEFNLLATEKGKQLKVGKRMLTISIIHADIFNQ